jgi:hypothetical protein
MDQIDKDHMLRTNQYYIAQVSSMEIKISELKAQLHAKDFEIDYLTSRLSSSKVAHDTNIKSHELEIKLKVALQENELLKSQISSVEELNDVKNKLDHAVRMKDVFEQKFRELNSKGLINEKNALLDSEKDETINSLKQQLINEKNSKEEFQKKFDSVYKENGQLKQEIIERNKMIQDLKQKMFRFSQFESEKKTVKNMTSASPNLFLKDCSSLSRKNSTSVRRSGETNLRSNLIYQSPKVGAKESVRRPKIVSISLES